MYFHNFCFVHIRDLCIDIFFQNFQLYPSVYEQYVSLSSLLDLNIKKLNVVDHLKLLLSFEFQWYRIQHYDCFYIGRIALKIHKIYIKKS